MMGWRALAPALLLCGSACSSASPEPQSVEYPPITAERCLVRLHGKGGHGSPAIENDGWATVSPDGNANGWGGRQWLYFPEERYEEALGDLKATTAGCQRIILNGFSNGGAFAAKVFCSGESFDGRLVRVVIDDPVTDAATASCEPASGVGVTLYWTGGLDSSSRAGADCKAIDWTCDGGLLVGLEAFAAELRVTAQPSVHDEHEWYVDAPELSDWD